MRTVTAAGRTWVIHEREDWQNPDRPVTGPPAQPQHVHTVVGHYPGAGDSFQPPTNSVMALRNLQEFALIHKGFSLYYGFYLGPGGLDDVWEIRGFDLRNAANNGDFPPYSDMDDPDWNDSTVSFYVPCSKNFPPNDAQQEAFRFMLAHCDDVYGETLALLGHKDSDNTDCPGPLYPMLPALAVRPTPPPLEDDELAASDEIMAELLKLSKAFATFREREVARDMRAAERDRELKALLVKLDQQVS